MAARFFRQLGGGIKKAFGRTLPQTFKTFGRQLSTGAKLLPQAFKDTSAVYSDLERKTSNIPLVGDMFGFSAKGTQAIGDLLSGNFGKAYKGGQATLASGKDLLGKGEGLAAKGVKLGII